eukprot:3433985-Pyramimonas_sp.AAC.1
MEKGNFISGLSLLWACTLHVAGVGDDPSDRAAGLQYLACGVLPARAISVQVTNWPRAEQS